jgi:hypothetical protein
MAKSAEEIRMALKQKKELRSAPAIPAHNGTGTSPELRQRDEPRMARTSQLVIRPATDIDPTPPHSMEDEKALLGSMMADKGAVIPDVARRVSTEHFYIPAHRTIFQAILDNFEQVEEINFSTVTQYLTKAGQINSVGGPGYVTEIGTIVPTSVNFEYYLETVETNYALRRLITGATETLRWAYQPGIDVPALVKHVQGRAESLAALALPRKSGLTVRTPGELIDMTFDDTDNYFGDRILAASQGCTLLGPGGVGKSRLSLQLAVCMITGRDFIDMPTRAKDMKWLFVQTENSNRRLHYDLKKIVSALALTSDEMATVDRLLFIHTLENDSDCFLNLRNPANYAGVNSLVQEVQPHFVQWDPLNSFTDSDLNSDMDMRALISAISAITRTGNPNRVPLLLHHSLTGKIGAARAIGWDKASYGRNSKVLQAWTRAQINLAPRSGDDPNLLIMSCGKNNNGRLFSDLGLRFDEQLGIYVEDHSFDPEEFRQEVGISTSRRKIVTAEDVATRCEDGIPKPKLVARIKEDFGIQQRAAYDAVNRAEAAGLIKKNKGKNWNSTYLLIPQERRSCNDD